MEINPQASTSQRFVDLEPPREIIVKLIEQGVPPAQTSLVSKEFSVATEIYLEDLAKKITAYLEKEGKLGPKTTITFRNQDGTTFESKINPDDPGKIKAKKLFERLWIQKGERTPITFEAYKKLDQKPLDKKSSSHRHYEDLRFRIVNAPRDFSSMIRNTPSEVRAGDVTVVAPMIVVAGLAVGIFKGLSLAYSTLE